MHETSNRAVLKIYEINTQRVLKVATFGLITAPKSLQHSVSHAMFCLNIFSFSGGR